MIAPNRCPPGWAERSCEQRHSPRSAGTCSPFQGVNINGSSVDPGLADYTKCVLAPGTPRSTRDEPVHLSGSRLRTHQHWSPADANCCQSLLLDPDGIVRIDLHKRLFLLVTGRGESPRVFPYH